MSNFRVLTKVSTFEATEGGLLTGGVWMELGGVPFPEPGWNDFVLVVLSWWCRAVSELPRSGSGKAELQFMDGPLLVSISADADGQLRLVARTNRGRSVGIVCGSSTDEVRQQLLAAADVVLEYCEQHGIENNDVRELLAAVAKLQESTPS